MATDQNKIKCSEGGEYYKSFQRKFGGLQATFLITAKNGESQYQVVSLGKTFYFKDKDEFIRSIESNIEDLKKEFNC